MFDNAVIVTIIGFGIVGLIMAFIASRGNKHTLSTVMENGAVTDLSRWTEPNSDMHCDEQEYQKRAVSNADKLNARIKEAISFEQNS